ncbi:MAG: leucine-rich repeat domain-containing protein [Pseudobacteriovorax sp.]|nr:leucine-rich repeat domain-containing protein [Pseudobacteriovorax sp.]
MKLPLYNLILFISLGILGACKEQVRQDNRTSAPPQNFPGPNTPGDGDIKQALSGEIGLSLSPRATSNILEWEAVDSLRYDLEFVLGETEDFAGATVIEDIKSPYTHVKPDAGTISYRIVVRKDSQQALTAPVNDVPKGALLDCLNTTGTAVQTLELVFASSELQDCYLFIGEGKKLKELSLAGAGVTDISPLTYLEGLESLDISQNPDLVDLSPAAELTKLKSLNLNGNLGVTQIGPIATLVNLESLNIGNSGISDLTGIEPLILLNTLNLENLGLGAQVSLGPIGVLRKLVILNISGIVVQPGEETCPIVGVSPILYQICEPGVDITFEVHVQKLLQIHCLQCHSQNELVGTPDQVAASNLTIVNNTMPKAGPLSLGDKRIFADYAASQVEEDD